MTVRYGVTHSTCYFYAQRAGVSYHTAHWIPRETPVQQCITRELWVNPSPALVRERTDFFGNHVSFFNIQEPHSVLEVKSHLQVEVQAPPLPESVATLPWEKVQEFVLQNVNHQNIVQFLLPSPMVPVWNELENYATDSFSAGKPVVEAVYGLVQQMYNDFMFDATATTVSTPLHEVFRMRRGVCQDFAHLLIGCLRSKGIPARYVSGYLETNPPAGTERLLGADATHAWAAFYCPGFGWIDVDPTNNLVVQTSHITLGWGRDYGDVYPLRGVTMGGGSQTLQVGVTVERLTNN